jgi:hypothetical protein
MSTLIKDSYRTTWK